MTTARIKDNLLRYLLPLFPRGEHSGKIALDLKLPHFTIYTLGKEMSERGHVKEILTSTVTREFDTSNLTITQAGRHFLSKGGYKREARSQWWLEAPKKYWIIVAIFSVITFALPLYLQYCNKRTQSSNPIGQESQKSKSDTAKVGHR